MMILFFIVFIETILLLVLHFTSKNDKNYLLNTLKDFYDIFKFKKYCLNAKEKEAIKIIEHFLLERKRNKKKHNSI